MASYNEAHARDLTVLLTSADNRSVILRGKPGIVLHHARRRKYNSVAPCSPPRCREAQSSVFFPHPRLTSFPDPILYENYFEEV
jgi:hypothetical protein